KKSLTDPDLPLSTKMDNYKALIQYNSNLAKEIGKADKNFKGLTDTFRITQRDADGFVHTVSMMTHEFDRFGKVSQRGRRSFTEMFQIIGRNLFMYTSIAGGFYMITNAIRQS